MFSEYKYRFENLFKLAWEWYSSGVVDSIELLDGITFDPVCLMPITTIDVTTLLYICSEYNRIRYTYSSEQFLGIDDCLIVGVIHELCDKGVCYCMCIQLNYIVNNFTTDSYIENIF